MTTQTERAELVPLLDALDERMRATKVMDFALTRLPCYGSQDDIALFRAQPLCFTWSITQGT